MKSPAHFTTLATSLALFCALIFPMQPVAADLDSGAFDPATVLQTPPPQTGEPLAYDMSRVFSTQTRLIRYEATEYQRKVAEQRARAFVAAHRRAAAKPKAVAKSAETPKKIAKPKRGEPQIAKKSEPVSRPKDLKIQEVPTPKPLPRYIAVDTVKDKRASPKAKKVVMLWDTKSESLVGNNLYDVENPPVVGQSTKFQTYSAQYVGAGL